MENIDFLKQQMKILEKEREVYNVYINDSERDIADYKTQIENIGVNIRYLNTLIEREKGNKAYLNGFSPTTVMYEDIVFASIGAGLGLDLHKSNKPFVKYGACEQQETMPDVEALNLTFKTKEMAEEMLANFRKRVTINGWISFREVKELTKPSSSFSRINKDLKWGWYFLADAHILAVSREKRVNSVLSIQEEVKYLLVLPEPRKL